MLTGVITGSDLPLFTCPDLVSLGMYGENHIGSEENLCWITKAHYPMSFSGYEPKFKTNKQICLIRNPIDNFISYMNLYATASHNLVTKIPLHEQFPQDFDTYVRMLVPRYQMYIDVVKDKVS